MTPQFTPGPWKWWTSNSYKRLRAEHNGGRETPSVLEPYVCKDGQGDIIVTDADMSLIAAAPQMHSALVLGEEVAALTISFIEKACGQTADWLDAGNVLNDKILEFRRARASALAKTEKV